MANGGGRIATLKHKLAKKLPIQTRIRFCNRNSTFFIVSKNFLQEYFCSAILWFLNETCRRRNFNCLAHQWPHQSNGPPDLAQVVTAAYSLPSIPLSANALSQTTMATQMSFMVRGQEEVARQAHVWLAAQAHGHADSNGFWFNCGVGGRLTSGSLS